MAFKVVVIPFIARSICHRSTATASLKLCKVLMLGTSNCKQVLIKFYCVLCATWLMTLLLNSIFANI